MPSGTIIPPPPRATGNMADDFDALHRWAHDFHHALVAESKLGDPFHQATPGTFDPNNLPDPADSSIAKAQATANAAYARALLP